MVPARGLFRDLEHWGFEPRLLWGQGDPYHNLEYFIFLDMLNLTHCTVLCTCLCSPFLSICLFLPYFESSARKTNKQNKTKTCTLNSNRAYLMKCFFKKNKTTTTTFLCHLIPIYFFSTCTFILFILLYYFSILRPKRAFGDFHSA